MIYKKSDFEDLILTNEFGINIFGPKEFLEIVTPDVLLIPGLAFANSGERLGKGKGFFDKYLENFQGIKIGICFSLQVLPNVPMELHDKKMDYLVTDINWIKCI